VSQQSNSDRGRHIVEVSRSHTIRHIPGGSLKEWSARYRGRNLNNAHQTQDNWTWVPSAGFKPAIPAIVSLQTYALDRMTTGIFWGFSYGTAWSSFLRNFFFSFSRRCAFTTITYVSTPRAVFGGLWRIQSMASRVPPFFVGTCLRDVLAAGLLSTSSERYFSFKLVLFHNQDCLWPLSIFLFMSSCG